MSGQDIGRLPPGQAGPGWVPEAVRHYLAHTEAGTPIRALARAADCHASTVLRRVRRLESRRDDPLVDGALKALSEGVAGQGDDPDIAPELSRVLRRLSETGAVLAVGREMPRAVVVRESAPGAAEKTAVVHREVAQVLALNDWIASPDPAAKVARYRITAGGRGAVRHYLRTGSFPQGGEAEVEADVASPATVGPPRGAWAETPLATLARRRDRSTGRPFLTRDLVESGERLREDFELSQMGARVTQDWDRFLTGPVGGCGDGRREGSGASAARARLEAALADLGPGLGDVALRCCCLLEGMEQVERRMGWCARSGKVVLRIALQRLRLHYAEQGAPRLG